MRIRITFSIITIIGIGWYAYQYSQSSQAPTIDSYESCIADPDSITQESYPATCITHNGTRFIQPTTTPADNLSSVQTYTDIIHNYQVKLPSSWTVEKACNGGHINDDYICLKSPDLTQNPIPVVITGLLVIIAPPESSYFHSGNNLSQFCSQSSTHKYISCENLTINNYQMAKKIWEFPNITDILILDNISKPSISIRVEYPYQTEYIGNELNQILESFRFTDN